MIHMRALKKTLVATFAKEIPCSNGTKKSLAVYSTNHFCWNKKSKGSLSRNLYFYFFSVHALLDLELQQESLALHGGIIFLSQMCQELHV